MSKVKWETELKREQIEKTCIRITRNLVGEEKKREYDACINKLNSILDKNRINEEFENLKQEDYETSCLSIIDQLNVKNPNKLKNNCINKFKIQISDPIWIEKMTEYKKTFLFNELNELNTMVDLEKYEHQNKLFMKQILASDVKKNLQIYFKDIKLKDDPDFLTRKKSISYKLNKEYLSENIEKQEKLRLLATYLLTDGSLYKDGNNYKLDFTNKSIILIEKFMDILKEFIPNAHFNFTKHKVPTGISYQVKVPSNELAELLFEISPSYKTKPYKNLSECENEYKKELCVKWKVKDKQMGYKEKYFAPATYRNIMDKVSVTDILRIIFDNEGSVGLSIRKDGRTDKKLSVTCLHPGLAEEIRQMLIAVGIHTNPIPENYKGDFEILSEYYETFRDKIGFTRGVTKEKGKYLIGKNKSDILDIFILISCMQKDKGLILKNIPNLEKKLESIVTEYEEGVNQGISKNLLLKKISEKLTIFQDNRNK